MTEGTPWRRFICKITGHRADLPTKACRTCGLHEEDLYFDPPATTLGTWQAPGTHIFDVIQRPYWAILRRLGMPAFRAGFIDAGVKVTPGAVRRGRRDRRRYIRARRKGWDGTAEIGGMDWPHEVGPPERERLP